MATVPMRSHFISRMKVAPLIIITLLMLAPLADSFGQFVQRSLANNCVGGENVFIFTVSGCSVTWGVGGGSYTIISQNSSHIRLKWNSPTSTAYVYANHNCPNYPWSGSVYYPQFTIYSSVTPSASIVASQNNVCLGTNITFTATPTNGGSSPNYVWKVNGSTVASGSSNTYNSTTLQSGDIVKVEMASNAPCPSPTGATSNSITMNFTQPSPASVTIQGPTMPMCGTTGASFVASPTNGGTSPVYTWYKNGNVVNDNDPGAPSYMYTPQNPLGDADKIKCVMTSSGACVSGNPDTSNEITVSTTSPITPQASINPVPISFCEGSQVTFTANEAQGGYTFTTYSWKLNGEPVGTNSDTYVTTEFTSGSVVTVDVTVTGTCISQTSAGGTTAAAPIVVKPLPNASIDPSGSITIFSDETKLLDAFPKGTGHSYVWKRNGNIISGATASSYSTDIAGTYTVEVTYDGCTKTSPSLALSVNVKPVANAGVDKQITLPATSAVFNGSATDSDGTITSYLWTQQSGPFAAQLSAETTSTLTASNLTAGGTYIFRLTATDNIGEQDYDEVSVAVAYPPNNHNWIRETVVEVPGQEDDGDVNALDAGEKQVTWTYFDGLGRPAQKVLVQGSPAGKDVVQPMKYDNYGREVYKYLPYVPNADDGYFKPDVLGTTSYTGSAHNLYYTNGTGDKVADDAAPFSKTIFEQSPLNRVTEQGSPGTAWQPDATNTYSSTDPTAKFAYQINVATEVLKWSYVLPTTGAPMGLVNAKPSGSLAYYSLNQLTRNKSKDENHHEVIEYKDIEGRVVLKEVEAPGSQWAQTHYIYNDMGDLACVLPPEAVARLNTEYHQSGATEATKNSFLSRWAFRYTYDARHRMTQKQVPGAGAVYIIYDKRDRLVMTQDGNQRSGATKYWTFTKYDHLNRPILTGIYTSSNTLAQMQTAVDSYYDNLTGSQAWFETYVGNVSGNVHGYNNASFPQTGVTGYLSVTYYDNYAFRSTWVGAYLYVNDGLSQTLNGVPYTQPNAENQRVSGLATGTKVKVLDGGVAGGYTWLKSVSYYDDNQRVIQIISENYKGGTDRTSNLYDFAGRVLKSRTTHTERDITWTAKVGVKEEGNKLIRTASGSSWGAAGAVSIQKLPAGTDGWMEFVASEKNLNRMVGLSDQNTNAHYNTIDFAWYLLADGTLRIYESGANRGTIGTYAAGDVLRIERTGTSMKYYQNNVLERTYVVATTPALMADVSLHSNNTTVTNVRSSFSSHTHVIERNFEYDYASRLTQIWHRLDGQASILLDSMGYNELGQLIDKKLHGTDGTDFAQSVDYRYNIRGWLSKINESDLDINESGDPRDYFGMQLGYNDDLGTGNDSNPQYNGNISGVKWSSQLGLGEVGQLAYNYSYDELSRISEAIYRQHATGWATPAGSSFSVSDIGYDLNGNILELARKGPNQADLDILSYSYGSGTARSNQLLSVTDTGDEELGFIDGGNTGDDYRYDSNGNLINDLNKEIGSTISDNTNRIFYNYLNLPERVQKSGTQYVQYIYDASGRKLHQYVVNGSNEKRSDYVGEFFYENDTLRFVHHDEGRVVFDVNTLEAGLSFKYDLEGNAIENTGKGPNGTVVGATVALDRFGDLKALQFDGADDYVQIPDNAVYNFGDQDFSVSIWVNRLEATVGWDNMMVVSQWNNGSVPNSNAWLLSTGNAVDDNHARWVIESGTNKYFVAGMELGLNEWYHLVGVREGDYIKLYVDGQLQGSTYVGTASVNNVTLPIYIGRIQTGQYTKALFDDLLILKRALNEEEVSDMYEARPEYQYHLKDHLGNVRLTFTTKPETETYKATFENDNQTEEPNDFQNYSRSNFDLMDHTDAAALYTYSHLLNGGYSSQVGLAKSLAVVPGDTLKVEVFGKYTNVTAAPGGISGFAAALTSAFELASGGSGEAAMAFDALDAYGALIASGFDHSDDQDAPKAYLNVLLFDKDYNFVDAAYEQIGEDDEQDDPVIKAPHGHLSLEMIVPEAGYAYIFLSNENPTQVDVFFDDFKVEHVKSPIVEAQDFYPFGLTYNKFTREDAVPNRWKFQGQEHIDDLGLNWDSFRWRNHQPDIGRFFNVDPLAEKYYYNSPYAFSENKVVAHRELEGLESEPVNREEEKDGLTTSGPSASTDGNGNGEAHVAQVIFKEGGVRNEVDILQAKGTANGSISSKGAEGKLEGSVRAFAYEPSARIGSEENNVTLKLNVEAGSAQADIHGSISKEGLTLGLGAGAQAGKAGGTVGITLFGVTLEATGMVTGASAHAGAEVNLKPFAGQAGESKIGAKVNAGWGAGFVLGLNLSY